MNNGPAPMDTEHLNVPVVHQQQPAAANPLHVPAPPAPIPAPAPPAPAPAPVVPPVVPTPVVMGGPSLGYPMPQFESRGDPRSHLADLGAWARLSGTSLDAPNRLADVLQLSAKDEKAKSWVRNFIETTPNASFQQTADAFIDRFSREVRARNVQARDKLFSRQVRMTADMPVSEYISNFRQQIMYCPEMHEIDRIRWFQFGLTYSLQIECAVDHFGNEFQTLEAVMKYALGAERRAAVQKQLSNKHPRFSMMQKRENREWLEMGEFEPPVKQQRTDSAGPSSFFGQASSFTPSRGGGRPSRGGFARGGGRGAGRMGFTGEGSSSGPSRGGGRSFGRGFGRAAGRGGGRAGGDGGPRPDPFRLSNIHHPVTGRLLSMVEVGALHRVYGCYNCLGANHRADQCLQPKKPFDDSKP